MPSIGSSILPASALLNTPAIDNFTATLAGTEYSYTFPNGTREFFLQPRTGTFKMTYDSGQSGVKWVTIGPRGYRSISSINSTTITIYFQSTSAGNVLEIEYWT